MASSNLFFTFRMAATRPRCRRSVSMLLTVLVRRGRVRSCPLRWSTSSIFAHYEQSLSFGSLLRESYNRTRLGDRHASCQHMCAAK